MGAGGGGLFGLQPVSVWEGAGEEGLLERLSAVETLVEVAPTSQPCWEGWPSEHAGEAAAPSKGLPFPSQISNYLWMHWQRTELCDIKETFSS